jgi:hypothetical protein
MRRLSQPFLILLALLFLAEAWLWTHLEPIVARIVALIPLRRLKAWLAAKIETLSPPLTLVVFLVPVVVLFPLKIVGVWLLANHYWLAAMAVIVTAKLVGVGVAAFIFDVTRPKLMQMAWFRRVFDWVMRVRGWALTMIEPVQTWLRDTRAALFGGEPPRWLRLALRTRRRMHSAR